MIALAVKPFALRSTERNTDVQRGYGVTALQVLPNEQNSSDIAGYFITKDGIEKTPL